MNGYARSIYRELTDLVVSVDQCAINPADARAQLEGMAFASDTVRSAIECKYDPQSTYCKPETADITKAQQTVNDLNVKMNGTVYEMLVAGFSKNCPDKIARLKQVRSDVKALTREFSKLTAPAGRR
jgi:hypothetical protein